MAADAWRSRLCKRRCSRCREMKLQSFVVLGFDFLREKIDVPVLRKVVEDVVEHAADVVLANCSRSFWFPCPKAPAR